MGSATNRIPARRLDDASSLAGLQEFRPRLTIVLLFLTLMVAVVGWRIARDTEPAGSTSSRARRSDSSMPVPRQPRPPRRRMPRRLRNGSGPSRALPSDFRGTTPTSSRRGPQGDVCEPPGRLAPVPVRGRGVSSRGVRPGPAPRSPPVAAFPKGVRLGGAGRQVVRPVGARGASCIVVSDVDVTQVFDLVRRLFT